MLTAALASSLRRGAAAIPRARPAPSRGQSSARPPPGRGAPRGGAPPPPPPPPRPMGIVDANGNALRRPTSTPSPPRPSGAGPPAGAAAGRAGGPAGPPRLGTPVADVVVDVTEANFASAVLQCPVPVVLDCWASWCKPCEALTPRLEGVARAGRGALRLAKLNVDDEQALAAQLQVKSLPAVFGVVGGRVVASFTGAVGDDELRRFFDTLLAAGEQAGAVATPTSRAHDAVTAALAMVDDGRADEALDVLPPVAGALGQMRATAEAQLRAAAAAGDKGAAQAVASAAMAGPLWEIDEARARAAAAMVRAHAARLTAGAPPRPAAVPADASDAAGGSGDSADDAETLSRLAALLRGELKPHATHPDVVRALAAADLAGSATAARGTLAPLRAAAAAAPGDPSARLALAEAELGVGLHADAVDNCLAALKAGGPAWRDGAARLLLLKIFEVLGPSHELTVAGRKALSKLLFR